jgi:hypothetical protein
LLDADCSWTLVEPKRLSAEIRKTVGKIAIIRFRSVPHPRDVDQGCAGPALISNWRRPSRGRLDPDWWHPVRVRGGAKGRRASKTVTAVASIISAWRRTLPRARPQTRRRACSQLVIWI